MARKLSPNDILTEKDLALIREQQKSRFEKLLDEIDMANITEAIGIIYQLSTELDQFQSAMKAKLRLVNPNTDNPHDLALHQLLKKEISEMQTFEANVIRPTNNILHEMNILENPPSREFAKLNDAHIDEILKLTNILNSNAKIYPALLEKTKEIYEKALSFHSAGDDKLSPSSHIVTNIKPRSITIIREDLTKALNNVSSLFDLEDLNEKLLTTMKSLDTSISALNKKIMDATNNGKIKLEREQRKLQNLKQTVNLLKDFTKHHYRALYFLKMHAQKNIDEDKKLDANQLAECRNQIQSIHLITHDKHLKLVCNHKTLAAMVKLTHHMKKELAHCKMHNLLFDVRPRLDEYLQKLFSISEKTSVTEIKKQLDECDAFIVQSRKALYSTFRDEIFKEKKDSIFNEFKHVKQHLISPLRAIVNVKESIKTTPPHSKKQRENLQKTIEKSTEQLKKHWGKEHPVTRTDFSIILFA